LVLVLVNVILGTAAVYRDAERPYRIAAIDAAIPNGEPIAPHQGACFRLNFGSQQTAPRASNAHLTPPEDLLEQRFKTRTRPIVLISVSGGAYRATFWAAAVLDSLIAESGIGSPLEGFTENIVLLTGASGGMLAAAYFVNSYDSTWVGRKDGPLSRLLLRDIAHDTDHSAGSGGGLVDSLTPVVQHFIWHDLIDLLARRPCGDDRGKVLERQWTTLAGRTFAQLAGEPGRPGIIFQPTIVQTGEPLYITNIALDKKPSSRISLFDRLPGAQSRLSLATAARLSATFPIVSPSVDVLIPSKSSAQTKLTERQLVDAGYFDNQGVDATASFLLQESVLRWLAKNPETQIIIIEIRSQPMEEAVESSGGWRRALASIFAPVNAYVATRTRATDLLASSTLALVASELDRETKGKVSLTTIQFINSRTTTVPMSWRIEASAREALRQELESSTNRCAFDRLKALWSNAAVPNCGSRTQ
jgi:hypothetical protein